MRTFLSLSGVLAAAAGALACTAPLDSAPDFELPETCRDVVDAAPDATDGSYLLYLEHDPLRPWEAYCHDMQNQPREFLTLPAETVDANTSRLQSYDGRLYSTVTTTYRRVRLDPRTLEVDISDQTFADSSGAATVEGRVDVRSMPFGVATACSTSPDIDIAARSSIDLDGTPFALASDFCVRDADPDLSSTWRSNTKGRAELAVFATDLEVCAVASPAPCLDAPYNDSGAFQLQLSYDP